MGVVHFSHAADGGAGRAAQRASQACTAAGLSSLFAFVSGESLEPLHSRFILPSREGGSGVGRAIEDLQWSFIPGQRTDLSNSLLSIPYPGVDAASHPLFRSADIIHLHWPTWGITPATIDGWLRSGRKLFWTLHDMWPLTGGCHYSAGCEQYRSYCLRCPQLKDDRNLISNSFAEKLAAYGDRGDLTIITPSHWLAGVARESRILGRRSVEVVRNCIDLEVFAPPKDLRGLRRAFGIGDDDLAVLVASFDMKEWRKGAAQLLAALRQVLASGELAKVLPPGGRLHIFTMGKHPEAGAQGLDIVTLGVVEDDAVMSDLLGVADLVCVPSLQDNYPNVIVEAMACGAPVLATPVGGVVEMVEHGVTGVLGWSKNRPGPPLKPIRAKQLRRGSS